MYGNVLVGQSGGPTSVINASLFGVFVESLKHSDNIANIYGMINGIEGFLKDDYIDLCTQFNIKNLRALKTTPAAYLGSCRYKLPENLDDPVYKTIFKKFEDLNIKYFFYIGGNDSMDTTNKLAKYAKIHDIKVNVIGVPKTIDNDLSNTDHTPGYGSAAKYVATTVREICLDSSVYDVHSVTIIEIMGRHTGWLTASSLLARTGANTSPDLIYMPEVSFSVEQFVKDIQEKFKEQKNVIVCVSEGIKDKDKKFICEYVESPVENKKDNFGHTSLTGCGKVLENIVKQRLGVKVRSIELNVNQRCCATNSSKTDIDEAVYAGEFGVQLALSKQTGKMVSFKRENGLNGEYKLRLSGEDVEPICNKEKLFPLEWITDNGTNIHDDFYKYALPLINGDVTIEKENGLPVFCYR